MLKSTKVKLKSTVLHKRATPDLWLSSQPHGITAHWLVPNYTAWLQRHMCVKQLAQNCNEQRGDRDSNPRPVDRKSSVPASYRYATRATTILSFFLKKRLMMWHVWRHPEKVRSPKRSQPRVTARSFDAEAGIAPLVLNAVWPRWTLTRDLFAVTDHLSWTELNWTVLFTNINGQPYYINLLSNIFSLMLNGVTDSRETC